MSRLEKLIQQLCPDGVEYRTVGDVATITRGRVMSKDYIKENHGEYPVYSSQTENFGELGCISTYDFDGEYLTWTTDGANAGSVFYRNGKFSITNVCGLIKVSDYIILTRFLYYILSVEAKKYVSSGMGNPKLMSNVMSKVKVPIPPLEVQQEIVRILDQFTKLTAKLTAELTAELTARKKQYEYYRDSLLTFDDSVPLVTLGEIAIEIYRGSGIKRDEVMPEGIPCVRYGEIYTSYDISFNKCISHTKENVIAAPKYFEYGDIIFAITGEKVDEIAKSIAYLGYERCMAGGDIVVLKHKQEPRYLSYALSTTAAQIQKSKGKVKSKVVHSSIPALKEIKIPLPDMKTQIRIADLLDTFHDLCNDISDGLPAEIKARRKQYEYYRDKLLTFKEAKA